MKTKYAIKITNYYCGSNGSDSCSSYYIDYENEDKVVLFENEEDAEEFIASNKICPSPDQADVVAYSEISINKKELIDFIGKANDQLMLQDTVKRFCELINLNIEISYKYALYINYVNRNNDVIKKPNHLYIKNNNVVLFDSVERAKAIADFIYDETDDSWADVVLYQRIIKYDDNTIVYDIY